MTTGQPGSKCCARQQMLAAIFDQVAGDGVGCVVGGRPHMEALRLDLAHAPRAETCFHISSSVMSQAGAMSTMPLTRRAASGAWAIRCRTSRSAICPPMLEPTRICGPCVHAREDSGGLLQPAADGAVLEVAARRPVPRVVEPRATEAVFAGKVGQRRRLGRRHVRHEAGQPEQAPERPLRRAGPL